MIGVLMVSWFFLAGLTAWGFHLCRRHWQHVGARDRHHPMNGNTKEMPSSMYDWTDEA